MQRQYKRDEKLNHRNEKYQQRLSHSTTNSKKNYTTQLSTGQELLTFPELKDRPACVGRGMTALVGNVNCKLEAIALPRLLSKDIARSHRDDEQLEESKENNKNCRYERGE
jgi:hypothetical protein